MSSSISPPLYDEETEFSFLLTALKNPAVEPETILEEVKDKVLAAPLPELKDKVQGLAKFVRDLELNAEMAKKEVKRLQERARGYEDLAEQLRYVLVNIMQEAELSTVRSPTLTVDLNSSPISILSIDLNILPEAFKKEPVQEAKKKDILDFFKAGGTVPGVLVNRNGKHIVIR